jgi:hypothetical protein
MSSERSNPFEIPPISEAERILRKVNFHKERFDTRTERGGSLYEALREALSYYKEMRDAPKRQIPHWRYAASQVISKYNDLDTENFIIREDATDSESSKKHQELLSKYNKCVQDRRKLKRELDRTTKLLQTEHGRYQELSKIYDSFKKSGR